MIQQSLLSVLFIILQFFIVFLHIEGSRIRGKNERPASQPHTDPSNELDTSPSSHTSNITNSKRVNMNVPNSSLPERKKAPKPKEAGYYSRAEYTKRKAQAIFHSGSGYSAEESYKLAEKIIKERKRKNSQTRRDKLKKSGLNDNVYKKPGAGSKEDRIGRKIVEILGERNGIFKHDQARELAEKWYTEYTRSISAKYRKNQKQKLLDAEAKAKDQDANNEKST
jgi:hypothetical protein